MTFHKARKVDCIAEKVIGNRALIDHACHYLSRIHPNPNLKVMDG